MRMSSTQGTITASSSGGNTPNPPPFMYGGNVGTTSIAFAVAPPTTGITPTSYNVYRDGSQIASGVTVDTAGNNAVCYTDGNPPSAALPNGVTHTYWVTSVGPGGESPPSPSYTATTLVPGPSALPTPPTNPDSWIVPYSLPTGGTTFRVDQLGRGVSGTAASCTLDFAIANFQPGDNIVLTAGATYVTGPGSGYVWPQRNNPNNLWTYITTTADPGFNSSGTLIPPSYNTTIGAGATDLNNGVGGNWVPANSNFAIIECTVINGVVNQLAQGANYLRFVGIWFRSPQTSTGVITLTAAPAVAATSGTLTTPFTGGPTNGLYVIIFSDGESRPVTLTNGGTSVTWSPGLFAACTTTVQYMFTGFANQYCTQMPFPNSAVSLTPCDHITYDRCMTGDDPTKVFSPGYGITRYGFHIFGNNVLITQCNAQGHSDTWDGQSTNSATLTVAPGLGATSGVLAANYGPGPGNYQALFSNNQVCTMTFPGSATPVPAGSTVTWTPALTSGATTSVATMLPQKTGYCVNESHAIFIHGGTNICVQNCRLEAVTENWFAGGVWIDQNHPPTDVTCRHNWLGKNPFWFNNFSGSDFKNIFEHKSGFRIAIYGSVLSYCCHSFVQSQRGRAIVLWPNDQQGNNWWVSTTDGDVHDNLILHTGGFFYPSGPTGGVTGQNGGVYFTPCARFRFENNLCYMDPPTLTPAMGVTSTQPVNFPIGYNVPDQIWNHNTTIVNTSNTNFSAGGTFGFFGGFNNGVGVLFYPSDGHNPNGRQIYSDRMTFTNNYTDCINMFGGSGMGHGATTFSTLFPTAAASIVSNNAYSQDATSYTANDFPNIGYTGFANFVNNTSFPANPNDWIITTGTLSTAATDGGNLGWRGFFFITTNSPLPNATVGVAYTTTLALSGGKAPYSWALVSGPAWMSVSTAGVISGTPTAGTIATVTVKVTDSSPTPRTVQKALFLTVSGTPAIQGTWWAANSPWNSPIPSGAFTSPMANSATIMAAYQALGGNVTSAFVPTTSTFTAALVVAPAGQPTTSWSFTYNSQPWTFPKIPATGSIATQIQNVANTFASGGDTDRAINLYSTDTNQMYDIYPDTNTTNGNGPIFITTASVRPLTGSGWWNQANFTTLSSGTASGADQVGGSVKPSEWTAGTINHALMGAWPSTICGGNPNSPDSSEAFIFPARGSDSTFGSTANQLPEGARLQLDPTLTDTQLQALGVSFSMLPLCHALQTYGWYCMDFMGGQNFSAQVKFLSTNANATSGFNGPYNNLFNLPLALMGSLRWVHGPYLVGSSLGVSGAGMGVTVTDPNGQCAYTKNYGSGDGLVHVGDIMTVYPTYQYGTVSTGTGALQFFSPPQPMSNRAFWAGVSYKVSQASATTFRLTTLAGGIVTSVTGTMNVYFTTNTALDSPDSAISSTFLVNA